ncbi:caspase family protein [Actinacidiphila paucisporea]|uniref:Caspase domain-containing protein n=1 Tax=Actinacidiphila paucisporea TaxID=310782 RepID=A0A1M7NG59_9ACTN|nr:caspase family protein [Actinacidiphila paucisporea]SHN02708.1 Caspase domain-containing protein [Actinacidiphila paucisporea]
MARHRALLIGASDYEMRGVPRLPFVPGDLARLGSVLGNRGFDVSVVAAREGGRQVSRNFVDGQVTGFLRRAGRDDTLLVLLSGHGVHVSGRDFLVPEDVHEDTYPFESGCVAIDWSAHLDETPAGRVVFLIDACREGIEQESMGGLASSRRWGRRKVGAALHRKVAYVYACSAGQFALFVRSRDEPVDPLDGVRPGESFSIFSRSVADVITAHPGTEALGLQDFQHRVQDRITELHRAYRKAGQPQTLRVVTDIPTGDFPFLPPPRTPGARPGRTAGPSVAPPPPPPQDAGTPARADTATAATARAPRPARRPRPARTALAALAASCAIGVAAWAVTTYGGNSDDPGKSSGSSGPSMPAVSGVGALPACTPSAVEVTLSSLRATYARDDTPAVLVTATNSSDSDCKVDLGPAKAVLTVTKAGGDAPYWSSADCLTTTGSRWFLAPSHKAVTNTVRWNRRPSAPRCAAPLAGTAAPGTYLAQVSAPPFGEAETSFVLD